MTEIIAVRHGESQWNLAGKLQGWLDSPLTDLGIQQAEAVCQALQGRSIDAIYSSDLGRAVQTAEIIAGVFGLGVTQDVGLRERNLGMLQGKTMAQAKAELPSDYESLNSSNPDMALTDGESSRQRHERVTQALDRIARAHDGQTIAVVVHGGTLNSIMTKIMGLSLAGPRPFSFFNASINRFTIDDGHWMLLSWGEIGHLAAIGTRNDIGMSKNGPQNAVSQPKTSIV